MLSAQASEVTRKTFFSQSIASIASASLIATQPAHAAKYGGFGAGSPGVLNPTEAEVDMDVLKSNDVQNALGKVRGYQTAVRDMQAALQTDSQANLRKVIVKDLDFAALRATLNTVNTAFEEDTQRGTDLLIRAIIQDITELEIANQQKEGIPRSPRRLETMQAKLDKLDKAFAGFLAFAP